MAKKKQLLPKVLYVTREVEEGCEPYFLTHEDITELSDGEIVGIYTLGQMKKVDVSTVLFDVED